MIEDVLKYLQSLVQSTGLFSKVYDLCELITVDNKTYPAWYNGSEFQDISGFDRNDGTAYFRKAGSVNIKSTEDKFVTTSCGNIYDVSIPLTLVCIINKEKATCNNAFASDEFAEILINLFNDSSSPDNVVWSDIIVRSYTTNTNEVLKREYLNPSITQMNFKFAYIAIDIDMYITVDGDCLKQPCYNGQYN